VFSSPFLSVPKGGIVFGSDWMVFFSRAASLTCCTHDSVFSFGRRLITNLFPVCTPSLST